MTAILNSAILNLAILDSAILVFSFKLTHNCQDWVPPFAQNISLIHSDSTWWWKPFQNLSCWIQTLPSWIQTPCYLLSDSLKNTLTPLWFWLKLIQSDSNSFILIQLDDGSHLGFSHLSIFSETHLHSPRLVPNICTKKLHLFILTQLDDCSYLEICHAQFCQFVQKKLHSFILTQLHDGSYLELCHLGFSHFAQKELNSLILNQLDDGSHPELCHLGFRHCHIGFRHLVIFSQIHSKTLSLHSDSVSN